VRDRRRVGDDGFGQVDRALQRSSECQRPPLADAEHTSRAELVREAIDRLLKRLTRL
jgi:hypothetical protein